MTPLLAKENSEALVQLAFSRVLVAFDYDGTLAPIVARRSQAVMRPATAAALTSLCKLYTCAVISGRGCADVSERLGGAHVKYIVGNHGLEPGGDLAEYEGEVARARDALAAALAHEPAIEVEDKTYSLALHYRRSRRRRAARDIISRAVAMLPTPMRMVPGKLVVNVIPARAPNKGDALLELRERERADTALYVGDDVTDEDVFKLDQPGRLLGVRVGESRASRATYFLRDQLEIDRLLARLVALRTGVALDVESSGEV